MAGKVPKHNAIFSVRAQARTGGRPIGRMGVSPSGVSPLGSRATHRAAEASPKASTVVSQRKRENRPRGFA